MKGDWVGFAVHIKRGSRDIYENGKGSHAGEPSGVEKQHENGKDYNPVGSSSVGRVDSITTLSNAHSVPSTSAPNSVIRNFRDGRLSSERYYGENGRAYLDIDYSDHGNPSTHSLVPHEHSITFDDNGKMHRGKDRGIQ